MRPTQLRAFTLIELLVVVSIIALLAMVAYPTYQNLIQKNRRSDAKGSLMRITQEMERCYTRYRRFDSAACTLVSAGPTISTNSEEGHYAISSQVPGGLETLGPEAFTLVAVPQGGQARDTQCSRIQLTNTLARSAQDSSGSDSTDRCW